MTRSDEQKELLDQLSTWQEPLINLLRQYPVDCIAGAFGVTKNSVRHILDSTVDPQLACTLVAAQFHTRLTRNLFNKKRASMKREIRAPLVAYIRRQNLTVYADRMLADEIKQLAKALNG